MHWADSMHQLYLKLGEYGKAWNFKKVCVTKISKLKNDVSFFLILFIMRIVLGVSLFKYLFYIYNF
jgi:hypothetical protein